MTSNDINESIKQQLRNLTNNQESLQMLHEFGIYDWYFSKKLYETESVNQNEWAEVKELLAQMGKITGTLIKKLVHMGYRKSVELCVDAAKKIYRLHKDTGEAVRYLFWTLLMFVVGYTGNTLKDQYNDKPVVPGTHIEYAQENGIDTLTVTNSRGGEFVVKQEDPDKAPIIISVKKSAPKNVETKETAEKQTKEDNSKYNNNSPIVLLKNGQTAPKFYHASENMIRAIADIEKFVDHIYDAKSGKTKQISKAQLLDPNVDATIGYGHALTWEERKSMAFNTKWTKAKALEVFKKDIAEHERILNNNLKKLPYYNNVFFSQGFIDGALSLWYNCGSLKGGTKKKMSEFWRRLANCRVDKEHGCIDKSDVYFTISQVRNQNITERGHIARRDKECLIMQNCVGHPIDPELYSLKG